MYFCMKRRSWWTELPHIGEAWAGIHAAMKSSRFCSTSASVYCDSRTRCVRPVRPWVAVHHSSIASKTSSLWWTAYTGDCANTFKSESVMMTATSMMRSVSGERPVISMSSQQRLFAFCCAMAGSLSRVGKKRARL